MRSCLLPVLTCTLIAITVAKSVPGNVTIQLHSVSEKLDYIELLLNSTVDKISSKIDENTNNIKHMIKSSFLQALNGTDSVTNRSMSALLIIDVQNDFIDGSLSLRNCPSKHHGEDVVPIINHLLETNRFDVVVYTYDWHPEDHISFFDNLALRADLLASHSKPLNELTLLSTAVFNISDIGLVEQTLWPRHCVQNSTGAKLHRDLKMMPRLNPQRTAVYHVYKGSKSNIDSYSAFWDNRKLGATKLNRKLQGRWVNQVFVTGLATDWCVYSTAIHAIEYGYETFIIEDACRGVDEKTIKERLDDFRAKHGRVIQSNEIQKYLK